MSCRRLVVVGALLLWCAAPAAAQSLTLAFHDGRVDLKADNVPLRTILAEWSRVGGTTIVNAERVGGLPITVQLNDVPERSALEVLLRSVSGYMAGPRPTTAPGLSAIESILIIPTSSPAPPPTAAAVNRPALFGPPQPQPGPQIDPNDPEENPATDIAPGQPQPGPRQRPGFGFRVVPPNGVVIGPNGQPLPRQPDPEDQPPPPDRPATTPSNPFGVAPGSGSATPGVISPVPQQPQQPPRPNGDPEP